MIARPSTSEILNGIRTELRETVLPEVSDESVRVAVQMLDSVLRSLAVRAEHEIAWMHEEASAIEQAVAGLADRLDSSSVVRAAMADLASAGTGSLHLADVQRMYSAAGELLSAALEAALAAGDTDAMATLRERLTERSAHEMEIVGEYVAIGRV